MEEDLGSLASSVVQDVRIEAGAAQGFVVSALVTTILFLLVVMLLRYFAIRAIRGKSDVLSTEQRRWVVHSKNAISIAAVIGLFFIWAPQIHAFALSIAAFAVAFVVATKELILCLLGGVMRASTKPFETGDWVTVDGQTGEVVDFNAFAFRIEEVDVASRSYRYTGRSVLIPNSIFFTQKIGNANFLKKFVFHDVAITVPAGDGDPMELQTLLLEMARDVAAPHEADAQALQRKVRRKAGIDIGASDPEVTLKTLDSSHYSFQLRMFLPTREAIRLGSEVTARFLKHVYDHKKAA